MSEDMASTAFRTFAEKCPHRVTLPVVRRPGNALNVEIGQPLARCKLRPPKHWPEGMVGRWLASGGDALVLGVCSRACPLGHRWCEECGHREESHFGDVIAITHDERGRIASAVRKTGTACKVPSCGCERFATSTSTRAA